MDMCITTYTARRELDLVSARGNAGGEHVLATAGKVVNLIMI